jgi:RNA polymerase sigma factor (sigma-70 family)
MNTHPNEQLSTTGLIETHADYAEEARRLIGEHAQRVIAIIASRYCRNLDRVRWALGKAACTILSSDRSILTLATAQKPLAYLITYVRFALWDIDRIGKDARVLRNARRIDTDGGCETAWAGKRVQTPYEFVELKETATMARKFARKLAWRQRAVIALYYYRGLSVEEISRRLSTSRDCVRQLRKTALLRLRAQFKEAV